MRFHKLCFSLYSFDLCLLLCIVITNCMTLSWWPCHKIVSVTYYRYDFSVQFFCSIDFLIDWLKIYIDQLYTNCYAILCSLPTCISCIRLPDKFFYCKSPELFLVRYLCFNIYVSKRMTFLDLTFCTKFVLSNQSENDFFKVLLDITPWTV